ncbi:MAG: hypothetical protein ABIJ34_01890 [archaeon]
MHHSIFGFDFSDTPIPLIFEINGVQSGNCPEIEKGATIESRVRYTLAKELKTLRQISPDSIICITEPDARCSYIDGNDEADFFLDIFGYLEEYPMPNIIALNDQRLNMSPSGQIQVIATKTRKVIQTLGAPENIVIVTSNPTSLKKVIGTMPGESVANTYELEYLIGTNHLAFTYLHNSDARKYAIPFLWHDGNLSVQLLQDAMERLGSGKIFVKPNRGLQGVGGFSCQAGMNNRNISELLKSSQLAVEAHSKEVDPYRMKNIVYDGKWIVQPFVGNPPYATIRVLTIGSVWTHGYIKYPSDDCVKVGSMIKAPLDRRLSAKISRISRELSPIIHESQYHLKEIEKMSLQYEI